MIDQQRKKLAENISDNESRLSTAMANATLTSNSRLRNRSISFISNDRLAQISGNGAVRHAGTARRRPYQNLKNLLP